MTKIIIILIATVILTSCTSNLGSQSEILPSELLKTDKEYIIHNKEVDDIRCDRKTEECVNHGKAVKYYYTTNEVLQKQITRDNKVLVEEMSLRTNNSQFFKTGNIINGVEELRGIFYEGTPFIKKNEVWYQVEEATTTIEAFTKQTKVSWYKTSIALADTISPFATAGSGYAEFVDASWDTAHDAATAELVNVNPSGLGNYGPVAYISGGTYKLRRVGLYFDTSAIGSGSTISSADLKFFTQPGSTNNAGTHTVNVYSFNPAGSTIAVADYNQFGTTEFSTSAQVAGTPGPGTPVEDYAQNTFSLNGNGIAAINKTGETVLGLRVATLDVSDTPPNDSSEENNSFLYSAFTSTDKDPFLEVVFAEAVTRRIINIE